MCCLSSFDRFAACRSAAYRLAPATVQFGTLDKVFLPLQGVFTFVDFHQCSISLFFVCPLPRNVCFLQWPAVHTPMQPQNGALKLYGGAAFERCLAEFQEAAQAPSFPPGMCICFLCSLLHS